MQYVDRPKHGDGDVDADYRPRTSVACVSRHSPVAEFTVLLYPLWARGGGECRPIIIATFNPTIRHVACTWIVTWMTTHAADRHAARTPKQLARI